MKKYLSAFFIITLFIVQRSPAQELIPIGQWRVHLSYNETHDVEIFPGGIIAAATDGIYIYENDGSLRTLTTLDGLHPSPISAIGYMDGSLFVGHKSGAIDILKDSQVITLTNLLEDSRTLKAVHDFLFYNGKVYISTDIGVLVYDPSLGLFTATYDELGSQGENLPVYDTEIYSERLFVATEKGIISGLMQGVNLNDFRSWKRYNETPNVKVEEIVSYNNGLYAALDGEGIFTLLGGFWELSEFFVGDSFADLFVDESQLFVTTAEGLFLLEDGVNSGIAPDILVNPVEVTKSRGHLYVADLELGVVRMNGQHEVIKPSGPTISDINRLEVLEQKLYALSGQLHGGNQAEGFSVFNKGVWDNYSSEATESAYELPVINKIYDVGLFNGSKYFTSLTDGLLIVSEDIQTILKAGDQGVPFEAYGGQTVLTGLAAADQGVWMVNYGAENSLHFYNGSSWLSYDLANDFIADIAISPQGLLVLRLDPFVTNGVIIFNPETGQQRLLDSSEDDGGLPTDDVNDIVFDRNGNLWFATSSGIAYLPSLNNIFSGDINAIRPVYELTYLLRNVNITSLAFDGGNRMWAGSDQGVWLFNAPLNEEVHYFNEDNSPILSNKIDDIILLQSTGEVFFATDNGLISYRSASSTPALAKGSVKVFPNPVTPDFSGTVGLSGVTFDAIVKITDEAGNLVYQTRANGSTAEWDLLDINGQRVSTGIYLVFTSSQEGEDDLVGKLAVIR